MKKIVYLMFVVLLFSACKVANNISPEYVGKKIPGKKLGIYLRNYNISCKDEVESLGEGDPKRIYKEFFESYLHDCLINNGNFSSVEFLTKSDLSDLKEKTLEIDFDNSVTMDIPMPGSVFKADSTYYDVVLIIEDLKVEKIEVVNYGNNMNLTNNFGLGVNEQDRIETSMKYLYWDNEGKTVIGYGKEMFKMGTGVGFGSGVPKGYWSNSLRQLSYRMLLDTPFYNIPEGVLL